ncbi:hypothetical protein IEQ34_011589 [Dendrobium chrysotoxum]|uniref:Uncharacterized protein n=1 Tax=Dendrobium chrysotoxum TaxID=161865 RepID=A0AAV7GAM2_DENCH|nr:hypothetical protein IEQ34_011589 [Dendrobium chrysotoxum]
MTCEGQWDIAGDRRNLNGTYEPSNGCQKQVAGRVRVEPDINLLLFNLTQTRPSFGNRSEFELGPDLPQTRVDPARHANPDAKKESAHELRVNRLSAGYECTGTSAACVNAGFGRDYGPTYWIQGSSRGKFWEEEDLFGIKGPGYSAAPGKVEENIKVLPSRSRVEDGDYNSDTSAAATEEEGQRREIGAIVLPITWIEGERQFTMMSPLHIMSTQFFDRISCGDNKRQLATVESVLFKNRKCASGDYTARCSDGIRIGVC